MTRAIEPLLALCARENGSPEMYDRLDRRLHEFANQSGSWSDLISQAEHHGIAPLFYTHLQQLDGGPPRDARRLLSTLYLRSRTANTIRLDQTAKILAACQQENLAVILVKGIALCRMAYSDDACRPMRDIDLLVGRADLHRAAALLADMGYVRDEKEDLPDDYYHLPTMSRQIDGMPVGIELHHDLSPPHPHYERWPLERFIGSTWPVDLGQTTGVTLAIADMFNHVYTHGFRAPLTYEPFRLIHAADLFNLAATFVDAVDWPDFSCRQPACFNALAALHGLTPWPIELSRAIGLDLDGCEGSPPSPYHGWPRLKIGETKPADLVRLGLETLRPPRWWLQVYYGCNRRAGCLRARLVDHPRQLLFWARAYLHEHFTRTIK